MTQRIKQTLRTAMEFLKSDDARPSRDEGSEPEDGVQEADLEARVIAALRTIYDPEIPVNIYELGLIYACRIDGDSGRVDIDMTLTAPGCPVAQSFPATVEARLREVEGITAAKVTLVWDPPWTQDRMSEAARLQLGMY